MANFSHLFDSFIDDSKQVKGLTEQEVLINEEVAKQSLSLLEVDMTLTLRKANKLFKFFYPYQKKVILEIEKVFTQESIELLQIAIAGANAIGKTVLMSAIVTHLMYHGYNNKSVKIICLSGKYQQLMNVLFSQIKTNLKNLDSYTSDGRPTSTSILNIVSDKITRLDKMDVSCVALSWDPANPDKIKGIHAFGDDGIVVVLLDECTAIPQVIIDNIKTTVARSKGVIFAIANPYSKNNAFYDFFKSRNTVAMNVSLFDLPQETHHQFASFEKIVRDQYSVDSHQYRTQILGQFSNDDVMSFFPSEWINASLIRTYRGYNTGKFVLGVDVAGGSEKGDFSVVVVRQGLRLVEIYKAHEQLQDFTQTVLRFMHKYRQYEEFPVIGIDACGIGLSVTQALERQERNRVFRINGSEITKVAGMYNKRIEYYEKLRKWMEFSCMAQFRYVSPVRKFNAFATEESCELNEVKKEIQDSMFEVYMESVVSRGEISNEYKLGKKSEMHKKSPDILDALSYTFVVDDVKVNLYQNDLRSEYANNSRGVNYG